MEFHISRSLREKLDLGDLLFSYTGNVVFANVAASRRLVQQLNDLPERAESEPLNAGALFALGLIDELSHAMVAQYRLEVDPDVLSSALRWYESKVEPAEVDRLLLAFTEQFPNVAVFRNDVTAAEWLKGTTGGLPNREAALEEMLLLWLANSNTAFSPFRELFEDAGLEHSTVYGRVTADLPNYFATRPPAAPQFTSLLDALRAPMLASPDSLTGQLDFIREHWVKILGDDVRRVLLAVDTLREEDIAIWMRFHPPGPGRGAQGEPKWQAHGFDGDEYVGFEENTVVGPDGVRRARVYASDHQAPLNEYEAFSPDQAWMPNVVLMAKSTYVWLEQLSRKYQRHIHRLDQIPDEELRLLAARGMTGLWLIGLWERSTASQTIKRLRGQSDAVASAYSLKEYRIAEDLGGTEAYENLRNRAGSFGVRLASDMVPNHMGIDSTWVIEHPEWFISQSDSPFPVYGFDGPDLSRDTRVEIKIEDHYYDQTDAAVAFRLRHHHDGTTRYMYHGNDGTTFAWNDTAQLDYSKHDVREHVIQTILQVARLFPIIRFDAAMTLAKRHVQRLWFPLPGVGGSIPSRAEHAMSQEEFDSLMPREFWREVVDRVAVEVPGTLLLAEAFWLLESYFVRTLGMHRVYNSAFMNMMRDEENAKYRSYLKKTIEFDPDILKRYVNFMSNPDERTAIDQFGSGDKFFGTSMLLATLPGLPMFAHGEIEGLTERYGMDFKHPRMNESPNEELIARHQREIAPLLKNRHLFAESTNFVLYDFWTAHGTVDENVFAYSNRSGNQSALMLYNNSYGSTHGTIHVSASSMDKASGSLMQRSLSDGLALPTDDSAFVSYRDTLRGLEYICRATEILHQGRSFELKGYGYLVLQDWQVRWASAEQPWGELCDALHGAGVYHLDEALAKLRLRPLHEALREVISSDNLRAFARAAEEVAATPLQEQSEPAEFATLSSHVTPPTGKIAVKAGSASPGKPQSTEDPTRQFGSRTLTSNTMAPTALRSKEKEDRQVALTRFLEPIGLFFHKLAETSPENFTSVLPSNSTAGERDEKTLGAKPSIDDEEASYKTRCQHMLSEALKICSPDTSHLFEWPETASRVLPIGNNTSSERLWAPLLVWAVLRSLPGNEDRTGFFDRLQLRSALAEIFSAVGIEGEDAWRAAARVRVLLLNVSAFSTDPAEIQMFWDDPDVRWLTGVNSAHDRTFFNKEAFEQLICWLQIPTLVPAAPDGIPGRQTAKEVDAALGKAFSTAASADYDLSRYLSRASFVGATIQTNSAATRETPKSRLK
ncbi:MAG: alpha-amylase family glycosyl hydrolase [Acidobacteriota bacterium]|nr:alpha-amylase family glycosyl hydrolase [Acidobacteriota bacterium]